MKCPFCSHENTRVIDSRPAEDNNSIRRRRVCDECGKRFTTYEKIETIPLIIIKKDNNREAYDRAKIEAGVLRACHKRPVSAQQITTLVDEVENEIFNREEREIPSGTIGELVINDVVLKEFVDSIACVAAAEINILNPDSVIFGGGVINMKGFPKDYLEERLYIHMRKPYPAETLQVQYSEDKVDNGVKGAIIYAKTLLED